MPKETKKETKKETEITPPTKEDYKVLVQLAQTTLLPMNLTVNKIIQYHKIK